MSQGIRSLAGLFAAAVAAAAVVSPVPAVAAEDLFANGSFELGRQTYRMDTAGATVASFQVQSTGAADGRHCALVRVGKVEQWGAQFGQLVAPGKKGRTYTFAVLARAVDGPVTVDLQIERSADPYDRAARTGPMKFTDREWTELHVTFPVEKDFPQGWFAYVSCQQADCRFLVDAFRLYEGNYAPLAAQRSQRPPDAMVRLFDTGAAAGEPISPPALAKRDGWGQVPAETMDHAFRGDAVLMNGKLAVALRRKSVGAELYAAEDGGWVRRAALTPLPGKPAEAPTKLGIAENTPTGAAVVAGPVRYRLAVGQPYVETEPVSGAEALRVHAPCRFAVLPDFFADDMVLDAAEMPVERAEVAADHFLLQLAPDRGAIVMAVRTRADDDVLLALSGEGEKRAIDAAEMPFGKEGSIHVAVLAARDIWHRHDVTGGDVQRAIALDWSQPLPALWRVDWRRHDGLTDSWEMIAQRPDGQFTKYAWFGPQGTVPPDRKRWTTVLGSFQYPCWLDRSGRGYLQPLKRGVRFEGPAILYPVNRAKDTPLDAFTVVDVVRAALGVGPCEYVLDVEGAHSLNRGRATCATRDTLNPIYQKGRQRSERARIEKTLEEVMVFIRFIRTRIEEYLAFGHEVRAYLADQRKAHPELVGYLDELDAAAKRMDEYLAARRGKVKTPDEAQKMVDEFRRTLLDYEGPDAYARCRKFTTAWVEIGGNQDELVGECRLAVRLLRQRAGLAAAREPKMGEIAREVRRRSQQVLRRPAGHEGAHH